MRPCPAAPDLCQSVLSDYASVRNAVWCVGFVALRRVLPSGSLALALRHALVVLQGIFGKTSFFALQVAPGAKK